MSHQEPIGNMGVIGLKVKVKGWHLRYQGRPELFIQKADPIEAVMDYCERSGLEPGAETAARIESRAEIDGPPSFITPGEAEALEASDVEIDAEEGKAG